MILPAAAAIPLAGLAFTPISKAVAALYGVTTEINAFLNKHIKDLQASTNETVANTGRILEGAKFGFGLGYMSSVAIIAAGQYLLGNTLAAAVTVATAVTLSNPIVMTCAAVGAILYGWNALDDKGRTQILDSLAGGLEIGVELVKSIIEFVLRVGKQLFSSKLLKEMKHYIAETAALFGRSLSDVTHLTVDLVSDAATTVKGHAELAFASTTRVANQASDKVGVALTDLSRAAGSAIDQTGAAAKEVLQGGKEVVRRARRISRE